MHWTIKPSIGICLVSFLFSVNATGEEPQAPTKQERGQLEGTWDIIYENNPAPRLREVKIINQTHFMWVTYVRASGIPVLLGGGTYTFDGKTYKEFYEFGSRGIPQDFIGKEQVFTAELKGDIWIHRGKTTNGFNVDEMWKRVK
ncbi:MAG TPA: hypothetical protein VIH42_11965 [Thermoguttaceae bacterium]